MKLKREKYGAWFDVDIEEEFTNSEDSSEDTFDPEEGYFVAVGPENTFYNIISYQFGSYASPDDDDLSDSADISQADRI